jgi:predicted PurR-regulated permease PerM
MSPSDRQIAPKREALQPGALLRVLLTVAFSVMGILLVAQFAGAVAAPLVFVLLAAVLALGLNPLVARLEGHLGVPRPLGAGLVVGGLVLFALAFAALVVPLVVSEGVRFAEGVPGMLSALQSSVLDAARKYPALAPLLEDRTFADPSKLIGSGMLESGGVSAVTNLASFVGVMANAIVSGVLLTMLVLFLLMSPEPVVKGILGGIPPRSRPIVERTLIRVGSQLGSWLVGAITVSVSVGVIVGVGLRIVGFQDALLFGVIAAVTNLIPFVGPVIGMVPPVLMALSGSQWGMALWAVGIALAAQQLDAYVLSPIIYGRTVKLHPASNIVAVLVFGSLMGLVGVFLAVPLVIILKALYEEVYLFVLQRPEASDESVAQVLAAGVSDQEPEDDQPPVLPAKTNAG